MCCLGLSCLEWGQQHFTACEAVCHWIPFSLNLGTSSLRGSFDTLCILESVRGLLSAMRLCRFASKDVLMFCIFSFKIALVTPCHRIILCFHCSWPRRFLLSWILWVWDSWYYLMWPFCGILPNYSLCKLHTEFLWKLG